MQPEELKQAIQKIKMWQRSGERAPHKPLLLLYALGRLARGEPRQMKYKEVKDDLKNLLNEFGHPLANHSPSYPFIRLCNDRLPQSEIAIWQIKGRETLNTKKDWSDRELIDNETTGGFAEPVYKMLQTDQGLVNEIATTILRKNFPDNLHEDILDQVGLDLDFKGVTERVNDKAIRFVDYLKKIAELQGKTVKTIDNYQQVLWLNEIPNLKSCYIKGRDNARGYDESVWFEVQGRKEPSFPPVPKKCENWIDTDKLKNKEEIPLLSEEINQTIENPDWHEKAEFPKDVTETLFLNNYPEIEKLWDQYIENNWWSWKEEYEEWEQVDNVYKTLFKIHQEQLKLGEEYELVIGLGLLTWKNQKMNQIQRHIIIASALIEFEAKSRKFTVSLHPDGANLRVELDMLEGEIPVNLNELDINNSIQDASDDLWNHESLIDAIRNISYSLQGDYFSNFEKKANLNSEKPVIELAPALILRKRSIRGLTEALNSLKKQLEHDIKLPPEFASVVEEKKNTQKTSLITHDNDDIFDEMPIDIMFPKPSNDEQKKIIERHYQSSGVLVQGPPGTGKSHSIANIICHLLSEGKRVLITAKTPRALKVLEEKLHDDIKPLCVNLLGSGHKERDALEKSIGSILHKTNNSPISDDLIEELKQKLRCLREDKAVLEKRLRAIRESDTIPQTIIEGAYRGRAAQIALMIYEQEDHIGWMPDKLNHNIECPINTRVVLEMLDSLRNISDEEGESLKAYLPESLPEIDVVQSIFESEKECNSRLTILQEASNKHYCEVLSKLSLKQLDVLLVSLGELIEKLQKLIDLQFPWIKDAINDVARSHLATWQELYNMTLDNLKPVRQFAREADDTHISIPPETDKKLVYQHAKQMIDYLKSGGKIKWGILNPPHIKPLLYLTKQVLVNGSLCNNEKTLATLFKILKTDIALDRIQNFWGGKLVYDNYSYVLQLSIIESNADALNEVFALSSLIDKVKTLFKETQEANTVINWTDQEHIGSIIHACKYVQASKQLEESLQKIRDLFDPVRRKLQNGEGHPSTYELLKSVKERSIRDYANNRKEIDELNQKKTLIVNNNELLQSINKDAPIFVQELLDDRYDDKWTERLRVFVESWNWSRARSWIYEYINKDDTESIYINLERCEQEIEEIIAQIASNKAWKYCMSRMEETDKKYKEHMELWQQHIRKYGKGTGKHAPYHRREARKNLELCRDAVPAWVMPLHRVWDTVEPYPNMFDVIIVDEASQCGVEALPLMFMGKKIIIVGDDKQISPEAVGIDQSIVIRLMNELLYDFEFKSSFNVNVSLFDQAKMRYGANRVALREHFRCMPEIIKFSNQISYVNEPLIPLRQYGSERLEPLKKVYIEKGYREGSSSKVINKPEAFAVADKIYELCLDPRYEKKTMGVVVLQGEAQASLIESLLLEKIGAEEIEARQIICGNPYAFQGDERDIIFLSMVGAPNAKTRAMNSDYDQQRFNVATSRAKDQLWLFHSMTLNDLSPNCYRYHLIEFFEQTEADYVEGFNINDLEYDAYETNRSTVKPPKPFDSWFEVDVALELARRKYKVLPQFEVAGKYIDLVVDGGMTRIAVECDGDNWHGIDQYEADLTRERKLIRCGWTFFRIREAEFYANKQAVIDSLVKVFNKHSIFPLGYQQSYEKDTENKHKCEHSDVREVSFEQVAIMENKRELVNYRHIAPGDIHEAMGLNYTQLRDFIISTIKMRPNHSCVWNSVVKYLLQWLSIKTRGKPRENFAIKVDKTMKRMVQAGILKEYLATNRRVKLAEEPYLSMAIDQDR